MESLGPGFHFQGLRKGPEPMLNLTIGIWTNTGFDVLVLEEVVKMVDNVGAVKVDKLVVVDVVVTVLVVVVVEVLILMSCRDGFSDVVV